MPVTEFNDDSAAIDYIRQRGYASYSSIKNVRDCVVPAAYKEEVWHRFGKEHHSRYLEKKKLTKLTNEEESRLRDMMMVLSKHKIAASLVAKSRNEIDYGPASVLVKYKSNGIVVPSIYGLPVYGRIDILNINNVCDLKTTKLTNKKAFAASMDFLQAAVYLAATDLTDFYYIGQSKVAPYTVMVFNVNEYPERLLTAVFELKKLCKYISKKL